MPIVIGIRFKDSGKTYHFDPRDVPLDSGDWAIVETVRGPELGRVASLPQDLPQEQLFAELKPVLRRATQADIDNLLHLQQYEPEAVQICAEKVVEHKLPMRLVKAEYNFDGSRLTFFFTADKRVDFRALVRDLARTFRTRIELRQVGPRDEAKLLGGIGPCGRLLCCSTFLPDFARVSIKMAKDQDLPLNPSKISGVCGRLLCCLSYEHEQYLEIKAELPQRGDWVQTPEGPGEVVAVNVVKENVTVELTNGNAIECTAQEILDVRRRVAAEAQARNAEGVTPASQRGPHPALAGEEGMLDDPEDLRALKDLAESEDRLLDDARPSRREALRPDVALGATLNQRPRRAPAANDQQRGRGDGSGAGRPPRPAGDQQRGPRSQPPRTSPVTERPSTSAESSPAETWEPQSSLEPHKQLSGGSKRHKKQHPPTLQHRPQPRQAADQAAPETPQQPAAAPAEGGQGAPADPNGQPGGARRRKRHRGRGGKS
jgi:cell fate regulator YaaT (PSP1 superfamily)